MTILSGATAAEVKNDLIAEAAITRPKQGYLPALDGWRAIAIFAVIQFHDGLYQLGPFSNRLLHTWGYLGVDLFFAISGFLICSRLLDEQRRKGAISLRGFYIRRSFRIMPAAWLFLGVCALLSLANILPRDWGGLVASLLMVRNFWVAHAGDTPAHWYTIHFWSLSVEEHFYLLLPGLLVLLARKRQLLVTGIFAASTTLWTLAIYRYPQLQAPDVWLRTDERLCQLMVPAFFAILLTRESVRDAVMRLLRPWVAFVFVLLTSVIALRIRTIGPLAIIIGFPLVVISTVYHPQSWTTRVLEMSWLKYIGRISYSLYLWQELFFIMGHDRAGSPLSVLQYAPFSYLAAFAMAVASFYLIEKPMIKIGHKFA